MAALRLGEVGIVVQDNHRAGIGGAGPIVLGCPSIQFHPHRDDSDQHENHAQQQHHGIDTWWLLSILSRV
jgi:hypothetical protein